MKSILRPILFSPVALCLGVLLTLRPGGVHTQERAPESGYAALPGALEPFIQHELTQKGIPAISIALVDGQRVVWAHGYGFSQPRDSVRATANTVHRVGSVSKLFTDIAIMQLVEQGKLDLDAPVRTWLPDFAPRNSFGGSITLRHLMSHRSGLTREPPAGNYFDDSPTTLARTVESLNATDLIHAPGTRTKYSNAGIATAGYVLERVQGESFYRYVKRAVLEPMGMRSSAFEPLPALNADLANAYMWSYDGKLWEAPTFQLGMGPAGSMYSTVLDLSRFMSVLFNGGTTAAGARIIARQTLEQMWTPQFVPAGAKTGFGLGFSISQMDGRRLVGHDGAIYGFATSLQALPDDQLGVVVVATLDGANSVADRIANAALRMLLAAKQRRALPLPDTSRALADGLARRLAGRYASAASSVDLQERNGRLFLAPLRDELRLEVRALGQQLVTDDRLAFGTPLVALSDDKVRIGTDTFARVVVRKPAPAPAELVDLIGEYGWKHNTLYIFEKEGELHALVEWFFEYPLRRLGKDRYAFPAGGLYPNEKIEFERRSEQGVTAAIMGTVRFPRRQLPSDDNTIAFKIVPRRPVDELRREALAATPPVQPPGLLAPDLVEVRSLDAGIRYDLRYATANNFMGTVFYPSAHAFLQRPAAEAVARAHRKLQSYGYGILIHDAYRPWYATKMFWEATPDSQRIFVANPAQGSRHNRGAAVDLTMYDLATGTPVRMTGGYDEFSDRSFPDYPGGTTLQRWQRDLLRRAMEEEGFTVYDVEWWHFDYRDWRRYPVLNRTFEELLSL
jgi:CubicO group peptidase (beta-lactamase class C family)/D-alanyl-D-alanine dipeptidase